MERAQILKAQGKTSKPTQVAKVAAAATNMGTRNYSGVLRNSSPKVQQPLPSKISCAICQFGHATATCGRLRQMTVEKRLEELRRRGICFNCLSGGHISRLCDQPRSKCGSCGDFHHTVLHVERKPGGGGRGGGAGGGNGGGNGGNRGGSVAAVSAAPPAPPAPSAATTTGAAGATGTGVLNAKPA